MSKGKVLLEKESASSWTTKNAHARENVNVAQGPRTGNAGAHAGKRGEFKSAKAEREPLAKTIMDAFGKRGVKDNVDPKLEPVSGNTKAKFKK